MSVMEAYMRYMYNDEILAKARQLLISDPAERTFSAGGENVVNAPLINGEPSNRHIYLKVASMWKNYDHATRLAF